MCGPLINVCVVTWNLLCLHTFCRDDGWALLLLFAAVPKDRVMTELPEELNLL